MTIAYLTGLLHATELPATPVELPRAKKTIEVSTMLRQEKSWPEPQPASFRSVPNKPAFQFDGRPIWAEFIVLRLMERDGWNGVWVKNWGGRRAFWRDVLEEIELPPAASKLFRRVEKRVAGRGGGCWDVFVWRGDDYYFIESKQRGNDRLRLTQTIWIESALDEGLPLSSFVIVEWLREPQKPKPQRQKD